MRKFNQRKDLDNSSACDGVYKEKKNTKGLKSVQGCIVRGKKM